MRYADSSCTYVEKCDPHVYIFKGECILTGVNHEVSVPANELNSYRYGAYIQEALKSVDAGDREFLMSGISPDAYDIMMRR